MQWWATLQNCGVGLLALVLWSCVFVFGCVALVLCIFFFDAHRIEIATLWTMARLPISVWLLVSPLICLWWLLRPAKSPWAVLNLNVGRKSVSCVVSFGGFLGCAIILTRGVDLLLWFIPDTRWLFPEGWVFGTSVEMRHGLAVAVGVVVTLALSGKLAVDAKRVRDDSKIDIFRREAANRKRELDEGRTTLAVVSREITGMWERVDRLSDLEYIRLDALEHVWHEAKDLRENIRRIRELDNLWRNDKLGAFGRQRLLDLAADFEESHGQSNTELLFDSTWTEQDLIDELADDLEDIDKHESTPLMGTLPLPVQPFVKYVWSLCDPAKVAKDAEGKSELGSPPKELRIFEAKNVEWETALCSPPYVRAWAYNGHTTADIPPDDTSDCEDDRNGDCWSVGTIFFGIDHHQKQAVYYFLLAPRYGAGYRTAFGSIETLEMLPDKELKVWPNLPNREWVSPE